MYLIFHMLYLWPVWYCEFLRIERFYTFLPRLLLVRNYRNGIELIFYGKSYLNCYTYLWLKHIAVLQASLTQP